MTKKRVLEIDCCENCRYIEYMDLHMFCTNVNPQQVIEDEKTIPSYCPLDIIHSKKDLHEILSDKGYYGDKAT
jgi:hypothetical protein